MEELKRLKDTLCDELEEYSKKGKMSAGDLEVVDKLTHTIKNLDKIIENYDEEYSGAYMDGMHYSRARGRGARRDSRGRYSSRYSREGRDGYSREYRDGYSEHDMIGELKELMEDAPDERTRMEFDKFIRKMEMM